MKKCNLLRNIIPLGSIWSCLCLFLVGCGTLMEEGTPSVEKHAKRGYNKPYEISGNWYYPQEHYEYSEVGKASHYGHKDGFHGRKTSTGERFSKHGLTCAHKTVPIPSVVKVTNLENGRSLKLKVIDRGPFVEGRIIDVSSKAAKLLGFYEKGITDVRVETLVDESMILAHNYNPNKSSSRSRSKKSRSPYKDPTQPSVLLASHEEQKGPLKLVSYMPNTLSQKSHNARQTRSPLGRDLVNGVFVQMGVYLNPERAKKLARLTNQKFGIPAKSYRYNKGGQQYHRVLVGPFSSSENATNLMHQIQSYGYRNVVVVYE